MHAETGQLWVAIVQAAISIALPFALYILSKRNEKRTEQKLERVALQALTPDMQAVMRFGLELASFDVASDPESVSRLCRQEVWPTSEAPFEVVASLAPGAARDYMRAKQALVNVVDASQRVSDDLPLKLNNAQGRGPLVHASEEMHEKGAPAARRFLALTESRVVGV